MIDFLLDTNICIYIIKKKPQKVLDELRNHDVSEIGISSITLGELEYGANKSSRVEENKFAIAEFVAPLEIIDFNDNAARAYGEIRADLEKRGKVIGPLDMLIGAHALSLECTLVTNNTKEFKRIKGLELANWTRS